MAEQRPDIPTGHGEPAQGADVVHLLAYAAAALAFERRHVATAVFAGYQD